MRKFVVPFMLAVLPASILQAAEPDPGKQLHDQHCTQCHGSEVMTRKDRRVNNLQELGAQVRQCDSNLGLKWFDDDIEAVTQYLNQNFYHFNAKK